MSVEVGLKILKELIMKEPNTLFKVPFQVENYKEVVKKLRDYKKRNIIIIDKEIKYVIRSVFDFHLNDKTHAIVFYSLGNKNALILGRIKEKYINLLIPVDDMICNFETSFIATYVP